ncbi:MAG: hypothetical protein ACFCUG_09475 [Thiotrichales bacterium]
MATRTSRGRAANALVAPTPVAGAIVIEPAQLQLRLGPGAITRIKVMVGNYSAMTQSLDPPGVVCLRQPDALARGLRDGFVTARGDFVSRLVALGQHLENAPSVVVEYCYGAEFAALRPGETGVVAIELRVDAQAAVGDAWTARLPLLGATLPVNLSVSALSAAPSKKQRGKV